MTEPPLKLFSDSCDDSQSSSCSSSASEFRRQHELDQIAGTAKPKTMTVAFGSLVQLLSQAIQNDSAWLDDFANDTVQIDADLHEVILKYNQLHTRRAA